MLRQSLVAVICVVGLQWNAPAQEWARKMFKETSHAFGTVAKDAKVEYEFKFKNIYVEDIHIASVSSSCGCTTPSITKDTLKTYETSSILAHYNTDRFTGKKGATIKVVIDKPFYAEVQLKVAGFIRTDINLQPEFVDLGSLDQGSVGEKSINVSYLGGSNWKILDVKSANPHLEVEVDETERRGGRVSYAMKVRLNGDAPAGYIKEQLTLVTNDKNSPEVPVMVEGRVVADLTVSPSTLSMGALKPGQSVTRKIVIQGKRPFKITSVSCEDDCFKFDVNETEKKVHLIPVTFTAGDKAGKVTPKIKIVTEFGEEQELAELSVFALVVEPKLNK